MLWKRPSNARKKEKNQPSSPSLQGPSLLGLARLRLGMRMRRSPSPPELTADQLLKLGRECGFDEAEEGELIHAASQFNNGE
jgi:hypothetical protein